MKGPVMRSGMCSRAVALLALCCYLLAGPGHALADFVCGKDLDGDGYADGEGETALCLPMGSDWFCPVGAVDCTPQHSEPACPPGGTPDSERGVCQTAYSGSCPSGYAYQPSEDRCEAAILCPEGMTFDAERKLCQGADVCPLGGQYACVGEQGASRCSSNICIDLSVPDNEILELPEEDVVYQDDGPVDEAGNCLGELYIFSGKATRCRPPGVTVGYLYDWCDNDAQALSDATTGSRITSMVTAAKRSYEVARVAYYSYQIATGAMTAVEGAGGVIALANTATGATVATFGSGSAIGAGVMAAEGAVAGGATASSAVGAGLQSYASALLNPATIAVSVAVMVAMKVLFGGGCDQKDVETALLDDSDYCVYLGTVCEKKWPMVGCVQRAKRFCCFNSKMARIIHEQGRPQLKVFGPDGGWGDLKNPNCRGFTPEEFQQLDFAKIDLSEYFGDITRDMSRKVQEAQGRIQQGIQRHYEQIR